MDNAQNSCWNSSLQTHRMGVVSGGAGTVMVVGLYLENSKWDTLGKLRPWEGKGWCGRKEGKTRQACSRLLLSSTGSREGVKGTRKQRNTVRRWPGALRWACLVWLSSLLGHPHHEQMSTHRIPPMARHLTQGSKHTATYQQMGTQRHMDMQTDTTYIITCLCTHTHRVIDPEEQLHRETHIQQRHTETHIHTDMHICVQHTHTKHRSSKVEGMVRIYLPLSSLLEAAVSKCVV